MSFLLFRTFCKIIVEQSEYILAFVSFPSENDSHIYPVASYKQHQNNAKTHSLQEVLNNELVQKVVQKQLVRIIQSTYQSDLDDALKEEFIERGIHSMIALPLSVADNCIGALTIISDEPFIFVDNEINLLKELAEDLAHGIITFRVQVEREAAEVALRNSEEQYKGLFNGVPVGIYRASPEGLITDANPALLLILGFPTKSSIMRVNFNHQFLTVEDRKRLYEEVDSTGYARDFETKIINKSGKALWIALNLKAVYAKDNTMLYVEGTVEDITHRKHAEVYIHSLTQELIKAQENERQRIARDLHDHVAQNLGALKISCDTIFKNHMEIPENIRKNISSFSKVLSESISSVREIAYDLRPPSLDQMGLIKTIARYCEDYADNNTIEIDFFSAGMDAIKLDNEIEINFYRLIQEALNNIKKHSEATQVNVRLVASYPDIILRIEDNGKGFDVEKRMVEALNERRMGLKSMEERVSLLNGEMSIKSQPGKGTKIVAKIKSSSSSEGGHLSALSDNNELQELRS